MHLRYDRIKRGLDLAMSVVLIGLLSALMIMIAVLIRSTSKGSPIFWSDRIGIHNRVFRMPKFRTMRIYAPNVATHLMTNAEQYVTPLGRILRKTSLDELPQLFSVLKGDMSFVGPRPALFNQDDLIALRTEKGVHNLIPGITGWAQVNGRDELPIPIKVRYDVFYLQNRSLKFDMQILFSTVLKVTHGEGVNH